MPTMTTSVFSVAMAHALLGAGLCLQAGDGGAGERLAVLAMSALGVEQLRAGKADQPPAREILVAAIDRVGEHAFHGVGAQRVEEGLRGRDRRIPPALPCSSAPITSSCWAGVSFAKACL